MRNTLQKRQQCTTSSIKQYYCKTNSISMCRGKCVGKCSILLISHSSAVPYICFTSAMDPFQVSRSSAGGLQMNL